MKLNSTIIPIIYLKCFCLLFFSLAIISCKKDSTAIDNRGADMLKDTLVINIPDLQNQTLQDEDTIRKTLFLIEKNDSGYDKAKITDGITTMFVKYNYITRQPEVTITHNE